VIRQPHSRSSLTTSRLVDAPAVTSPPGPCSRARRRDCPRSRLPAMRPRFIIPVNGSPNCRGNSFGWMGFKVPHLPWQPAILDPQRAAAHLSIQAEQIFDLKEHDLHACSATALTVSPAAGRISAQSLRLAKFRPDASASGLAAEQVEGVGAQRFRHSRRQ